MNVLDNFLQENTNPPKPVQNKTDYKIVMERLRVKKRMDMEKCVGLALKPRTMCELQGLQNYLKGCTRIKFLMHNNQRSTLILDKKIYRINILIANKQYKLAQMG